MASLHRDFFWVIDDFLTKFGDLFSQDTNCGDYIHFSLSIVNTDLDEEFIVYMWPNSYIVQAKLNFTIRNFKGRKPHTFGYFIESSTTDDPIQIKSGISYATLRNPDNGYLTPGNDLSLHLHYEIPANCKQNKDFEINNNIYPIYTPSQVQNNNNNPNIGNANNDNTNNNSTNNNSTNNNSTNNNSTNNNSTNNNNTNNNNTNNNSTNNNSTNNNSTNNNSTNNNSTNNNSTNNNSTNNNSTNNNSTNNDNTNNNSTNNDNTNNNSTNNNNTTNDNTNNNNTNNNNTNNNNTNIDDTCIEKTNYNNSDNDSNLNIVQKSKYNGIQNQGATCYLDSLLQSLYHIPEFRRIVYSMPRSGKDITKDIPLCLQLLFIHLQIGDSTAQTKDLTRSFGWNEFEVLQQHDIHELYSVLLDNIESKLKGTELNDSISKLIDGMYKQVFRIPQISFEKENNNLKFNYLTLTIQGLSNLKESFKKYLSAEDLDDFDPGLNTGKYRAQMHLEFVELPKVLTIQLERFGYDLQTFNRIKINSRFEFPLQFDMIEYINQNPHLLTQTISPSLKPPNKCLYELHSVLVHSGTPLMGHYYAFIRPTTDKQFYKFNDSYVSPATQKEAIEGNYGDGQKTASAYLLIYIKKDDEDQLYQPIPDSSIPPHLVELFSHMEKEKKEEEFQREKEKTMINVNIFDPHATNDMCKNFKLGLFSQSETECKNIHLEPTSTKSQLYDQVLSALYPESQSATNVKVNVNNINIWVCNYKGTPLTYLQNNDDSLSSESGKTMNLFVEKGETIQKGLETIWAKYYDASNNTLRYIGTISESPSASISSLFPLVQTMVFGNNSQNNDNFLVFQETEDAPIEISPNSTISSLKTKNPLVFQIPSNNLNDGTQNSIDLEKLNVSHDSVKEYLGEQLIAGAIKTFKDAFLVRGERRIIYVKEKEEDVILFKINFSRNTTFTQLKQMIAIAYGKSFDPVKDSMELYIPENQFPVVEHDSSPYSRFFAPEPQYKIIYFSLYPDLSPSELAIADKFILATQYFTPLDAPKSEPVQGVPIVEGIGRQKIINLRVKHGLTADEIRQVLIKQDRISESDNVSFYHYNLDSIGSHILPSDVMYNGPKFCVFVGNFSSNNIIKCSLCKVLSSSFIESDCFPFWAEMRDNETGGMFLERLERWKPISIYDFKSIRLFVADSRSDIISSHQIHKNDVILQKKDAYHKKSIYIVFGDHTFETFISTQNTIRHNSDLVIYN